MKTLRMGGVFLHYNSDLSGNAIVSRDASHAPVQVEIPCSMLLEFVANYVRDKRIAELEQMGTDELLFGVKQKGEE